ncbi:unnamed protein product [Moneuplotes crassus]|uniref:Uncharacterized protein n=1 Tax=Euplotes crassus TaxID=5936 RepID=A0AAD1Y608_EUPCR|nr:unnamed protein product [Moneuplotes crassus]
MQERASSVPNLHKKIPNSPNSLPNDSTRRKHHFNRFQENKKKEKSIHDLNFSQAILQTLETSNSSLLVHHSLIPRTKQIVRNTINSERRAITSRIHLQNKYLEQKKFLHNSKTKDKNSSLSHTKHSSSRRTLKSYRSFRKIDIQNSRAVMRKLLEKFKGYQQSINEDGPNIYNEQQRIMDIIENEKKDLTDNIRKELKTTYEKLNKEKLGFLERTAIGSTKNFYQNSDSYLTTPVKLNLNTVEGPQHSSSSKKIKLSERALLNTRKDFLTNQKIKEEEIGISITAHDYFNLFSSANKKLLSLKNKVISSQIFAVSKIKPGNTSQDKEKASTDKIKKYLAICILKKIIEHQEFEQAKIRKEEIYQKFTWVKKIKRFAHQIRDCCDCLEVMKVTSEQILVHNLFPQKSYYRPGSRALIEETKEGNLKRVREIIKKNRFTLYDFDSTNQTALHWAAKRDFHEIIKFFIEVGCYIDCKDSSNRTPLYLACKRGNTRSVKILLLNRANPTIKTLQGKTCLDATSDIEIQSYLKKAILWRVARRFYNSKARINELEKQMKSYHTKVQEQIDKELL